MRIIDWSADVCSSDLPGGFAAGAVARQHRFALVVLDAVDIDLDLVADLQIGLLARRGDFAERDAAFRFQPDVDDGEVVLDRGDGAFYDLAFKPLLLAAEAFIQESRQIVAGWVCRSGHTKGCPSGAFNTEERL